LHEKYSVTLINFVKDVEDWFHYGKLTVFVIQLQVPYVKF